MSFHFLLKKFELSFQPSLDLYTESLKIWNWSPACGRI